MNVQIHIVLGSSSFDNSFTLDYPVPIYVIADKAYELALIFAETQYIARYGHPIIVHEFAEMLKELDYSYTIDGVEYNA